MNTLIERIQAMRAQRDERPERDPTFHRLRLQSARPETVTITAVHSFTSHNALIEVQGILHDQLGKIARERGYTKPEELIGVRLVPEMDMHKRWAYRPER